MPPLSHRDRPALDRALPRDTTDGIDHHWQSGNRERMLLLFGGPEGEWRPVRVLARWTDDRGRAVIQVEYFAELTTWIDEYLVRDDMIRQG